MPMMARLLYPGRDSRSTSPSSGENPPLRRRNLRPHEYSTTQVGIYTQWDARLDDMMIETQRKDWRQRSENLPSAHELQHASTLAWKFSRELAKENPGTFWQMIILNVMEAALPTVHLLCTSQLINIAHSVSAGRRLDPNYFALVFVGEIATSCISELTTTLKELAEEALNSRFALKIRYSILKLFCTLTDDELARPQTRRQLTILKELSGGSASSIYRNVFDPLGIVSVGSNAISLVLSAAILTKLVTRANIGFFGLQLGFLVLESWSHRAYYEVIQHEDVTNDAYLRFESLFRLGTSKRMRPEITMLGIQPHILASAQLARDALEPGLSISPQGYRRQSRSLGGSYIASAASFLARYSSPLMTALYILHATVNMSSSSSVSNAAMAVAPLVTFAELSVIENATWSLRSSWSLFRHSVTDVRAGMDKLETMYECLDVIRVGDDAGEDQRGGESEGEGLGEGEKAATTRSAYSRREGGMELDLRNVTVRHSPTSAPALNDVSFKISPGQVIAVCGENGSGKTTLVSLLAGLHAKTGGTIFVNGQTIESYSRQDLAQHMSFTLQSSPALPFSVKEYVFLGVTSTGPTDVDQHAQRALRVASADVVIDQLADGDQTYVTAAGAQTELWELPRLVEPTETLVPRLKIIDRSSLASPAGSRYTDDISAIDGEDDNTGSDLHEEDSTSCTSAVEDGLAVETDKARLEIDSQGKRPTVIDWSAIPTRVAGQDADVSFPNHSPKPSVVSGGQWQRIALARSLCSTETDLLVWDEPAAALDVSAEAALFDHIDSLRGKCSVLFTTHRLSACTRADKVLLFSKGQLVEQGTVEELRRIPDGEFARLWNLQARDFQI